MATNKATLALKDALLGVELPSNLLTKPGTISEGNCLVQIRQTFKDRHARLTVAIDVDHGLYGNEPSYGWHKENRSEPGSDYNTRNENLNEERYYESAR